ncbi:hypothetical protein PoB_003301200 [Plakobranchus ocellatus]|uniref:Uncharacterized protein n=1 Tax=Plakobranchus ocellatus TaxID=259542 RepID=A0AAV4AHW3_9GAST|nr:hypothetical protein PoB_003301200 [Plakobranchus ocellatus]
MENHGKPYGDTSRGNKTDVGPGINDQYGMEAETNVDHQIFEHRTHQKFKQAIESDDTLNGMKKTGKERRQVCLFLSSLSSLPPIYAFQGFGGV